MRCTARGLFYLEIFLKLRMQTIRLAQNALQNTSKTFKPNL